MPVLMEALPIRVKANKLNYFELFVLIIAKHQPLSATRKTLQFIAYKHALANISCGHI